MVRSRVARSPSTSPHNTFCVSDKSYKDFELNVKFKITPVKGGINSGVQIRSQRIANHHEMIGYQADAAKNYWGKIYDESRRRKVISKVLDPEALAKVVKPEGWNHYRILCKGPRIRMWFNDVACADYTEKGCPGIPLEDTLACRCMVAERSRCGSRRSR